MTRLNINLLIMLAVAGLLFPGAAGGSTKPDDKAKIDEIVTKHLDSIGKPEVRKATRPRVIAGAIEVMFRARTTAKGNGLFVMASEGEWNVLKMDFGANQYPFDRVGFNGSKVTASQVSPGAYSNLGNFVRSYPVLLKEGLLGGALTSAWLPLNLGDNKGQLEYGGTKEINNRRAHEIRYRPAGGSDLKISLFFDAETFQHVRSVYSYVISARMSSGGLGRSSGGNDRTGEGSASQSETRVELREEFSDFKSESGLTLPHTYKIHWETVGAGSQFTDWVLTLNRFMFDTHLEAKHFDVSTN